MRGKSKTEANKAKVEAALDEALEQSFPASDPPEMIRRAGRADKAPTRSSPPRRRPAQAG